MLAGFDPNQITNLESAREAIRLLLNLVEELKQENDKLRGEVQQLQDEINRLKGEQGKPAIKSGGRGRSRATSPQKRSVARPDPIAKAAK